VEDYIIMKIEIEKGIEVLTKKVKKQGNTGRIYLPVSWIGKTVKVVLIEDEE
jgi:putative transposon-encoded protein